MDLYINCPIPCHTILVKLTAGNVAELKTAEGGCRKFIWYVKRRGQQLGYL
jgi:hypothetical protein